MGFAYLLHDSQHGTQSWSSISDMGVERDPSTWGTAEGWWARAVGGFFYQEGAVDVLGVVLEVLTSSGEKVCKSQKKERIWEPRTSP